MATEPAPRPGPFGSCNGTGILDLAEGQDRRNFVRTIAVFPNDSDIIYAGTVASDYECIFRGMDGDVT